LAWLSDKAFNFISKSFADADSMKHLSLFHRLPIHRLPSFFSETSDILEAQQRRQPYSLALFIALCFNLVLAPAVYAATGEALTRQNAYAIGILLLVTLALSVYLFTVIFQPERF
jgi:K+-transporting ATPase KdpF subunit